MSVRIQAFCWGLGVALSAAALGVACGNSGGSGFGSPPGAEGGVDASTVPEGAASDSRLPNFDSGFFDDFPTTPIVQKGLPSDIAMQFGASGTGAPPCLSEPPTNAMVPRDWTPLFMEYAAPSVGDAAPDANVFEIKLTVDNQAHPLLAYVSTTTWTLSPAIWQGLTRDSAGHDIVIGLRSGTLSGGKLVAPPSMATSATVHMAPVAAPGSVVYWSASSGSSFDGFTIGDLTFKTVLTPATASPASAADAGVGCISCHTSSPDGKLIFYTRDLSTSTTTVDYRAVDVRTVVGAAPPSTSDVSPAALALLARVENSAPQLNTNHYSSSDSVVLTAFDESPLTTGYELAWTDLHATDSSGWGILARTGDSGQVGSFAWRHDGTAIAYASSATAGDGVTNYGPTDIYTVPYNNRMGGTATPLPGASDTSYDEFYPSYSPGDVLLAYDRIPSSSAMTYDQAADELFIVPSAGGTSERLLANDPPMCTGLTSPGLHNAWPRWAPQVASDATTNYYWVVFSSTRRVSTGSIPQLYMAAITTKVAGGVETFDQDYPAVYVLSQDPTQHNHIPAWDNFDVSGIPKPP
jgi:hypothetical protein